MNEVHIDTSGMTDTEKTVALITEIFKYVPVCHKKRKAKEIREANRKTDLHRKKQSGVK